MRLGLYPATFDPVHYGHIDVAMRALRLFDELVIAAADSTSKNILFSTEERVDMLKEIFKDVPSARITSYKGLTVQYAASIGAVAVVRGLRTVTDFDYELQLAHNYRHLNPNIEICCLTTSQQYSYLSSSMVKEIARYGGDVNGMVPPLVEANLYRTYKIEKKITFSKSGAKEN